MNSSVYIKLEVSDEETNLEMNGDMNAIKAGILIMVQQAAKAFEEDVEDLLKEILDVYVQSKPVLNKIESAPRIQPSADLVELLKRLVEEKEEGEVTDV